MSNLNSISKKPHPIFRYITPPVSFFITILLCVIYGMLCVILFEGGYSDAIDLQTLSWSFVMLVPYGIGMISVGSEFIIRRFRGIKKDQPLDKDFKQIDFVEAIFMPWLALGLVALVALAITLGYLLCFVISLPLIFPAASFGGLTIWLLQQHKKAATMLLLLAICAPFGLSTVEANIEKERETVHTLTSIHIHANAATVWQEIGRVDPITEEEHHFNWIHYVGIPRPVEATMPKPGLGEMRVGYFENGLRFEERVVEWEENKRMSFEITEASDSLLPKPMDIIDGETFDIVAGMYEIEELDDGTVMLHFSSEHFLSTRFNRYGSYWTDLIMQNLQNYILEIIKMRAEAA